MHLETLFKNDYKSGIKYFYNSKRKPVHIMLCFLKYSTNEDFDLFVNWKENLFDYLKWVYKNEILSNSFISKFLSSWNNSKAVRSTIAFERENWKISDENKAGILIAEENIENVWNNALGILSNDLEKNKQKILNIPKQVSCIEELQKYFIDLYDFTNKNSNKKKVFINILERFVISLKLNNEIESEILWILRLYRKLNVVFIFNNLWVNKENITDLNKLAEQSDDFYLTITSLQQKFSSLYTLFRTDIFSNDNDKKWELFVSKLNSLIDNYPNNDLENKDKIKKHISQLLLRTFTDRQNVYEEELDLLRNPEKDLKKDSPLKKYYTFEGKKLSIRTRHLYFILDTNYNLWVEKFASLNKSNSVIYLYLKLAKKEDIELHENKILRYYFQIFSKKFIKNKQKINQTISSIQWKIDSTFDSGYENMPISLIYYTLLDTNISTHLLDNFRKILADYWIDIEKKEIHKSEEKNTLNNSEEILEAFKNKQFYLIDDLLKNIKD